MPGANRFFLKLCTVLLVGISLAAQANDPELTSLFTTSGLPGYCGSAKSPEGSVQFSAGIAQREPVLAYSGASLQPIGSVSKPFIGLALAQMASAGTLDLDADINGYLPFEVHNPRHPQTPITLRQLASHTSSVVDRQAAYRDSYWRIDQDGEAESLVQFLASYFDVDGSRYRKSNFSGHAPGDAYAYSNMGAALAALVIERRSNMPFADYVQQHILAPLQMSNSGYSRPDSAAQQFHANGKEVPRYRLLTYPDGGLYSSCDELQRFLQAVMHANSANGDSTLDAKAVAIMLKPTWQRRPKGVPDAISNHALFWEIRGGRFGHTGGDPGVSAITAIDPAAQRTRVQLSNVDIDESKRLRDGFVALWRALAE